MAPTLAVPGLFFDDTTEVIKIVLPKVRQSLEEDKLYLLAQGTELKRFSFLPRNIAGETKGFPFQFLLALRVFFRKQIAQRIPFHFVCDIMDVEKPHRVALPFFSAL